MAENEGQKDEEVQIDAEKTAQREIMMQGTIGGIGAQLDIKEGKLVIKDVIVGTPSARAGLRPDSTILEINGISTKDMTLSDVVQLLRGPVGTKVKLDIQDGSGKQEQIEITREVIGFNKPIVSMVNTSIGMIQFSGFNNETPKSVSKAVENFQGQGAKGLILDLRGCKSLNSSLDSVKRIVELFLPKNEGLWLYEDKEGQRHLEKSSASAAPITLPLVVLIDEKTQDGELLAAAIKRNKRGSLIGQRTSGQTVAKDLIKNPDGTSKMIKKYTFLLLPNKPISGVGVEPDIVLDSNISPDEFLKTAINELGKKLDAGNKAKPDSDTRAN
jgi:carboxyl-terminal processing protease